MQVGHTSYYGGAGIPPQQEHENVENVEKLGLFESNRADQISTPYDPISALRRATAVVILRHAGRTP